MTRSGRSCPSRRRGSARASTGASERQLQQNLRSARFENAMVTVRTRFSVFEHAGRSTRTSRTLSPATLLGRGASGAGAAQSKLSPTTAWGLNLCSRERYSHPTSVRRRQAARRGTSPLAVTWSWVPEDTGEAVNPTGCYRKSFDVPSGCAQPRCTCPLRADARLSMQLA